MPGYICTLWRTDQVPSIELIDPNPKFVFKPLMYELLTGQASENVVAPAFGELLSESRVRHITGLAENIKYSEKGAKYS